MFSACLCKMISRFNTDNPEDFALEVEEPQCFSISFPPLWCAVQAASNDACQQMLSCSSCDCT